jgi:DNA-binding response OmpR family regulator
MIAMNKDGARVLVVDDEPNITELVAMALRYEGFNVKTAATGRGALTAVTQFAPSLVILDVMLPDIDGMEVLKRLNSAGNRAVQHRRADGEGSRRAEATRQQLGERQAWPR